MAVSDGLLAKRQQVVASITVSLVHYSRQPIAYHKQQIANSRQHATHLLLPPFGLEVGPQVSPVLDIDLAST
jgi:hypothetical protein